MPRPAALSVALAGAVIVSAAVRPARGNGDDALGRDAAGAISQATPSLAVHDEGAAEALVHRAAIDETEGAYARALDDDRAAVAAAPGSRWADRAAARVVWLEERSEGDFAPLARLQRVRADPSAERDPATLEALSRDADGFPPGRVRSEARMLVAQAWLGPMRRPERALAELRKVADDPSADRVAARFAARELVDTLIAGGHLAPARSEALARADALDPGFVTQVLRRVRRRSLAFAACIELVVFHALAGIAVWRARGHDGLQRVRRALVHVAPRTALLAGAIALGGVLASFYEDGQAAPFVALAASIVPIALSAAAWNASGSAHMRSRVTRALGSALSAFAAAFLALLGSAPSYLEGFGL